MPQSWTLFGFHWRGVDYVWTTLSFSWNDSPFAYSTLSEAKALYTRMNIIPAFSYIDDSRIDTPLKPEQDSPQTQWVESARALRFAVAVAYLCGLYVSSTKCNLVPTQTLRYLGIICCSRDAVFRVPQDKPKKLQVLVDAALRDKSVL